MDPNSASNYSTWNDARSYLYTAQRKQLASESWVPGAGQPTKTQLHEQDQGQTGGLGVHTGSQVVAPSGSSGNQMWLVNETGGQDAYGRVKSEISGYEKIKIAAQGSSKGSKSVELLVNQTTGLFEVNFPEATRYTSGAWNRDLWLPAGGFSLLAKGNHPSGQYTATATSAFNVGVRHLAVESGYDADGNVTDRSTAGGYTVNGRTQTLTWDGQGRLIKVVQQEFGGYGFEWTAIYDGRNRRVQTLTVPVRNSVPQPGQQVLERSWHDPLVEFLEVGLEVTRGTGTSGKERWWKIHGPDLNGGYGGLEGMGGLEALVKEADGEAVGMIDDAYGHIIGFAKSIATPSTLSTISTGLKFEYHSAQFGGYGAMSGTWSPAIAEGVSVWRSNSFCLIHFVCPFVRKGLRFLP